MCRMSTMIDSGIIKETLARNAVEFCHSGLSARDISNYKCACEQLRVGGIASWDLTRFKAYGA